MKLATMLGGLLLTALQASASPLDVVGTPQELAPAHKLEARDGWCCVGGTTSAGAEAYYVPRGEAPYELHTKNGCRFDIIRSGPDDCFGWLITSDGCGRGRDSGLQPTVQDASFCQQHGA
ncbi:hypothetical protein E4U43_007102 [Claviceps pusilla]|uniref:Uncharacterized protein n=1 Tax=Claviceps pusilla TaxID=123648 RepID=A0A9P7NE24_9HYPO|nr:hypothetical protein E4U43_007102 [Claviceps pusilla]